MTPHSYNSLAHTHLYLFYLRLDPMWIFTYDFLLFSFRIVQCLMNDPIDPFNRKALSVKDLIPQTELKEKITQWLKEKREEMRKK